MKKLKKFNIRKLLLDKLVIVTALFGGMFILNIKQFYQLQINSNEEYSEQLQSDVERKVEISASRGSIYDRYGEPLAFNKPIYVLKIDPQVTFSHSDALNDMLIDVVNLLEENGDSAIDPMPISKEAPFVFTEDEQSVRSFITNYVPYNNQEHKEELYNYSAEELMNYLRGEDVFGLNEQMSDNDARKVIAIRLEMRQTTYQKYKLVTIAEDISMKTVSSIEENKKKYTNMKIEVEAERYYTYGKAFGNILGYTRTITESQYEKLKEEGYDQDDRVGQVGIESTMEAELRGDKGYQIIEVDNMGRQVITKEIKAPVKGNDVYLTIDAKLQLAVYEAIEKRLSEAIVQRLRGQGGKNVIKLTGREVLVSMATNNQLDFKQMQEADESQMQKQLYDKINKSYQEALIALEENQKNMPEEERESLSIKQHFANMLNSDEPLITDRELLLAFAEQGSLILETSQIENIWNGNYGSLEALLIDELESGDLKPEQTSIMPFSASAVVVDVNSGETLALVGYPSFDSNVFTQDFNDIYLKLHDGVDSRNLETNRALKTARAPGSTFKMLVGIAGLEEGVISNETVMNDTGFYTKAGEPYPRCWHFTNHGYGHGSVDLVRSLEVSCNYYFYDIPYRLGLKYGAPYGAIDALTHYVEMFGLNQKTGIELEEMSPNVSNPQTEINKQVTKALNGLKNMGAVSQEKIFEEIKQCLDSGFYPSGDSKAVDISGKIDYLSSKEIKSNIDDELKVALSDALDKIYNHMMSGFKKTFNEEIQEYVNKVVAEVLEGESTISLKERTIVALRKLLVENVSSSTRNAIKKALKTIPKEILNQTYYDAYRSIYNRYKSDTDKQELVNELKSRMNELEKGSFEVADDLTDKILIRMIDVYLNDFFKEVDMEWTMGINIRTAIGQGKNAFTPVQIARYIAGLANGKEVYDLKVVNGIQDHKDTNKYVETQNKIFNTLDIKSSNLKSIYEGMRAVVSGSEGSARNEFADFEIQVAGKTGTAEGGKYEDSWFVGFAPYDNPQIAVVTSMYEADGLGTYNTQLARDIFEIYFSRYSQIEEVSHDNLFIE